MSPYLCIISAVTPVLSVGVGGKIVPGGAGSSCRLDRLFDGCDSLSEKEIKKFFGWFVRWHMVSDRFLKAFRSS